MDEYDDEDDFKGFQTETEMLNDESKQKKKKIIIIIILIIITIALIAGGISLILILNKNDKNNNLTNLVFEPSSGVHTHSFIFLPGYSNTPENYINIFTNKLKIPKRNTTRVIILRSPLVEMSFLKGENNNKNYAWFDMYYLPLNSSSSYNFEDLKKSSNKLRQVINEEAKKLGGDYEKIIIGGHSQGGFVSLYTGYNFEHLLGGLIVFSGVLPPQGEVLPGKENLKVYSAFGDSDNIILPEFYYEAIQTIKKYNGFHMYIYQNHSHHVCSREINDANDFLKGII